MTAWLEQNFDAIGKHDTVDLHGEFLSSNSKIFEKHRGDHEHKSSSTKRKTA